MKTNYRMLMELREEYKPAKRGVVSMDEIYKINEMLELDGRSELDLRNLRDFVVMAHFLEGETLDSEGRVEEMLAVHDRCSAITAVIDQKILNMGAEI